MLSDKEQLTLLKELQNHLSFLDVISTQTNNLPNIKNCDYIEFRSSIETLKKLTKKIYVNNLLGI